MLHECYRSFVVSNVVSPRCGRSFVTGVGEFQHGHTTLNHADGMTSKRTSRSDWYSQVLSVHGGSQNVAD